MNFRNFLNTQLLSLVKDQRQHSLYTHYKQELFFFQIGCFPSEEKYMNHEYPTLLNNVKEENINVNLVLIDPLYQNFLDNNIVRDRLQNYNVTYYIYDKILNNSDYNTLVEFCHFIANFQCLSIIMEMTGIPRQEYYRTDNHTEYLYITESDCQISTQETLFNPLLLSKKEEVTNGDNIIIDLTRFYFFRPEEEEHLYELFDYQNTQKLDFIIAVLQKKFKNVKEFYVKVLRYMKIKPRDFNNELELNYNKNYKFFYKLKENIYYRLVNHRFQLDQLFQEFFVSDFVNLEVFIKKKICLVFINCLHYKYRGDISLIQLNNENILFDTNNDINKVLDFLSDTFS